MHTSSNVNYVEALILTDIIHNVLYSYKMYVDISSPALSGIEQSINKEHRIVEYKTQNLCDYTK